MGKFTHEELQEALEYHCAKLDEMSERGDWSGFADLFTDDVHFVEHNVGVFNGHDDLEAFIVAVMAATPHAYYPLEWVAFDEPNDAVVIGIRNVVGVDPSDPSKEFWFPSISRLVYAGNHKFSLEEDAYNPGLVAGVVNEILAAGGKLAVADFIDEKGEVAEGSGIPAGLPLSERKQDRVAPKTWNSDKLSELY